MADPIRVDIPGVGLVEFPDSMTPDEVNAAAGRLHDVHDPTKGDPDLSHQRPMGTLADLNRMLEPLAHPTTLGDVASLMLAPVDATRSLTAGVLGRGYQAIKAAGRETTGAGQALSLPFRAIQKFRDALPSANTESVETFLNRGATSRQLPPPPASTSTFDPVGAMLESHAPVTAATPAATGSASAPMSVGGQRIDPTSALGQRLQAAMGSRQPMGAVSPIQTATAPAALPEPPVNSATVPSIKAAEATPPLRADRIAIGAERAGRAAGMSKEAVRAETGPVLGEAVGDASPILPRKAMNAIVDKLVSMGPKGSAPVAEEARDAYVMAANSEKARAQIKAYLDALRKVGFGGVSAVTGRQLLMDRMRDDQ